MRRLTAILWLAAYLLLAGVCGGLTAAAAHARGESTEAALAEVALAQLPVEAAQTLALIKRGGPFPYPHKDGSVFRNFERRLPDRPGGYYREFTVPMAGRSDRGPRRIVAGEGAGKSVATSGEYYYSGDHYRTFRRIRER